MEPFTRLSGPAAVLLEDNVDTDVIFPARFLLITAREGLGDYAFHDRRFAVDGAERDAFVLNQPRFRAATVLIAGANFGCGSSREQAVWALLGRGIRCVIAPSFGEIFHGNCLRNGVLPIVMDEAVARDLATVAIGGATFTVDLEALTARPGNAEPIGFTIAEDARQALLAGWDETELVVQGYGPQIAAFEQRHRAAQPWLFGDAA